MLNKATHKGSKLTSAGSPPGPTPPLYTVIMLIVNKNHQLHTLASAPLGRAIQGQHAAVQTQKKKKKKKGRMLLRAKQESCDHSPRPLPPPDSNTRSALHTNKVVIFTAPPSKPVWRQ